MLDSHRFFLKGDNCKSGNLRYLRPGKSFFKKSHIILPHYFGSCTHWVNIKRNKKHGWEIQEDKDSFKSKMNKMRTSYLKTMDFSNSTNLTEYLNQHLKETDLRLIPLIEDFKKSNYKRVVLLSNDTDVVLKEGSL